MAGLGTVLDELLGFRVEEVPRLRGEPAGLLDHLLLGDGRGGSRATRLRHDRLRVLARLVHHGARSGSPADFHLPQLPLESQELGL